MHQAQVVKVCIVLQQHHCGDVHPHLKISWAGVGNSMLLKYFRPVLVAMEYYSIAADEKSNLCFALLVYSASDDT
jgi:hypothetical protein